MNPLEELLALLAIDTEGFSLDELAGHIAAIEAKAIEVAEADDVTDEALEALDTAAERTETLRGEHTAIIEAQENRAQRAQAALDRIQAAAGQDEDPEPEAEPEPEVEPVAEDGTPEVEPEAEPEPEQEPVAIAADAGPARAPRLSRVAARRPATTQTRPAAAESTSFGLVASANVPGITAGTRLTNVDRLADALVAAVRATSGYAHGPRVKMSVAQASASYDERFVLDGSPDRNAAKMRAIREGVRREGNLSALVAAGGACAPYEVFYDQPIIGSDARPVRDQLLTRMQADRGGVTLLPSVRLSDVEDAVDFWDDDNGHVIGNEEATTKPVLEVACDEPFDADTYEVTRILRFSNFSQRYFRERVEAILNLVGVAQARKAERRLLTLLAAACVDVTSGQLLGATRDVLATLDRALAGQRNRYRIDRTVPMTFAHPAWLIDMMRADLARELPGSTDERLATADAKIASFFAARNIRTVALLDGESGQEFGPQGDGALEGWPSTAVTYLMPDGEAFFLDGGSLDLGIVRDSTLNGTNKFEIFAETSEGFVYNGATDPLRITMDLCPDGSSSATVDINPCSTGS